MHGHHVLCVDCGLTGTKAVLFSAAGEAVATASAATEISNHGDASEIDMPGQWRRAASVMREALATSGVSASDVAGIGASGHGAGLYPLDASGAPVCSAFTAMDGRAQRIIDAWARDGVSCYEKTRHHPWSGQPVPQLRWLRENRRDLYDRIRWVLGAKDWVNYNLTGAANGDFTDASNAGLLSMHQRDYDPGILDAFGIPEVSRKLPPLRKSSEVIGTLCARAAEETGCAVGTPVVGGLCDFIACALGSGVHDAGSHSIIAGTWSINTSFEERLVPTAASVKCSLGADGRSYAFVESSATSAGNLDWLLKNVLQGWPAARSREETYRAINEAVEKVDPRESRVLYMPFLYRSHLSRTMDACFLGLRAEHTTAHLLRAVFEGVAFAHRQHLDILSSSGLGRARAVLSGGAANSAVWGAIFSDVTGLVMETTRVTEAGALGAAVCAAVGTGAYGSLAEAVQGMVRSRSRHEPDPAVRALYDEKYAQYRDVIRRFEA